MRVTIYSAGLYRFFGLKYLTVCVLVVYQVIRSLLGDETVYKNPTFLFLVSEPSRDHLTGADVRDR